MCLINPSTAQNNYPNYHTLWVVLIIAYYFIYAICGILYFTQTARQTSLLAGQQRSLPALIRRLSSPGNPTIDHFSQPGLIVKPIVQPECPGSTQPVKCQLACIRTLTLFFNLASVFFCQRTHLIQLHLSDLDLPAGSFQLQLAGLGMIAK